jgi:hypothetical protein
MTKELIVNPKTEIAINTNKKDILALYEVPILLDRIIEKEKIELLNKLNCGAVILDSLNKLANSNSFIVEIPSGLREMIKSGKAVFDKSGKNPGSFTPNIRIKGEMGIKGQATIVQKTDAQAITQSLSNLAMMAMVQSVLAKLDVIEKKLEVIKTGQRNDRIGDIVGSFKGFVDLYPTFKTSEELNYAANDAYLKMQGALAKIHLQIEEERKELDDAPRNDWQAFLKSISNPFRNESERLQKCYESYVYDIQLYNRLILLTDIILYLKGDNGAIVRNHKAMVEYCKQYIDDSFREKMSYLMCNKTIDITNILEYNKRLEQTLKDVNIKGIQIECKIEDVKYLNNQ